MRREPSTRQRKGLEIDPSLRPRKGTTFVNILTLQYTFLLVKPQGLRYGIMAVLANEYRWHTKAVKADLVSSGTLTIFKMLEI